MIEPGIYNNLSIDEYHAEHEHASTSTFKDFGAGAGTPLKCMIARQIKGKPKKVYDYGTALHCAILEPDKYNDFVVVPPVNVLSKSGSKAGNKYKEWEAAQGDKLIIKQDVQDAITRSVENVFDNPAHIEAKELLTGGYSEVSVFWEMSDSGLPVKCRPDHLPGGAIVTDLKSCLTADPVGFGKQAYNLKYHWSAFLTLNGLNTITDFYHADYRFVCIEKEPPFDLAVYKMPHDLLQLASTELLPVIMHYQNCLEKNEWPGYPGETQMLTFPKWATKS